MVTAQVENDKKKQCSCQHSTTLFWCGPGKNIPVMHFRPDVCLYKNTECTCNKLASRGVGLTYKLIKTECRLLRQLLEGHGFREVHQNSNDFNIMWCGCHVKPYTLRGLTELQKVNHFPRSYEITRKDRLYKNFMKMRQLYGAKHYDFLPVTFVLPSEVNEFYSNFQREKGYWIAKPVASSRGRGITIINHPNQISLEDQTVVCKYISNPMLVDGFKFDLRIYVMVTSFDPLRVYIFNEGLARFSTVRYDMSALNLSNMFMHLTNYSVNKKNHGYVKCSDPDIEDYGNKWSMSALLRYLKNEGYDTASMMMKVEDMIIKTLLSAEIPIANACRMFLPHRENCFELFGFDVIFDDDARPWLLEVNLSPSLACESPLDLKIKSNLVSHMLTLAGVIALEPYSKRDLGNRRKTSTKGPYSLSVDGTNAAPLSNEDLRLVRQTKEEFVRKGAFTRIFPTEDSWDLYSQFLENKTHYNFMLHSQLYPNRARDKNRPSSAIVSMSKFRDINTTTNNKMLNYSTIYNGIRERYVRYETSLQPLGTVEDYPPEALVNTITPDFSLPGDSITDDTCTELGESDSGDDVSFVFSWPADDVKRTTATQTFLPDLENKACSPDSGVDTPDIPTDERPLADILSSIKRGCLRPLSFPECYHHNIDIIQSPTFSYTDKISNFSSTYNAFNPATQSFDLPLSRRERIEQYSMYVKRHNIQRTPSRVSLVDVKYPGNKSNIRLLPGRPRSGDKSKRQPQDTSKDDRERPGSLTLRSYPPDFSKNNLVKDNNTVNLEHKSTSNTSLGTPRVPAHQQPDTKPSGYRAPTKSHLSRTQEVFTHNRKVMAMYAKSASKTSLNKYHNSPLHSVHTCFTNTRSTTITTPPNPRPSPGFGNLYHRKFATSTSRLNTQSTISISNKKKKEQKPTPAIGVEVIKQNRLDFGYEKLSQIPTYDQFLQEQKKQKKLGLFSRPSSSMTLASSFKDVPIKTTRRDNPDDVSAKVSVGAEGKGHGKIGSKQKTKKNKKKNKSTSEISILKGDDQKKEVLTPTSKEHKKCSTIDLVLSKKGSSTNLSPSKKGTTNDSITSKRSSNTNLMSSKNGSTNNLILIKEPSREDIHERKSSKVVHKPPTSRPSSSISRKSTASGVEKVQTNVNVSVFTRDHITIEPQDVVVSKKVNRSHTTILVTVPHSQPDMIFKKSKIGRVEISLDRSDTPDTPLPRAKSALEHCSKPDLTSTAHMTTTPMTRSDVDISTSTANTTPVPDDTPSTSSTSVPVTSNSSSTPVSNICKSASSMTAHISPSQTDLSQSDNIMSSSDEKLSSLPDKLSDRNTRTPKAEIINKLYDGKDSEVDIKVSQHSRKKNSNSVKFDRDTSEGKLNREISDSGYSSNSPGHKSKAFQQKVRLLKRKSDSTTHLDKRTLSSPVPSRSNPRGGNKKSKTSKPSPYGSNQPVSRERTKTRAGPKQNKPINTEHPAETTPYGTSYNRYRPCSKRVDVEKINMKGSESGKEDSRSIVRKRIDVYSSQVLINHTEKSRKKGLTSNSLPSIYRRNNSSVFRESAERRLTQVCSDLVLNRDRLLIGSQV